MAMIEFRDVSFSRDGASPVLDHLTLPIESGELVALVGRSGAGKTTLLKLVNRLVEPSLGAVLVAGRDVRTWDVIRLRRSIGYVIQDGGLFPHMTVGENIATVPRLEEWDASRIQARIDELLDLVGLSPSVFRDRWPRELSGGQRQRVGVARALGADPPVLLMDEPFGALDPLTRAELQEQLQLIQQRIHKTVILVTHDIAEAMALGDRLAVLEAGRLLACAPPAEILDSPDPLVRHLVRAPSAILTRTRARS